MVVDADAALRHVEGITGQPLLCDSHVLALHAGTSTVKTIVKQFRQHKRQERSRHLKACAQSCRKSMCCPDPDMYDMLDVM